MAAGDGTSALTVLSENPPVRVARGTYLQQEGIKLFSRVLLLTAAVMALLFVALGRELFVAPALPAPPALSPAFQRGDTAVVARLTAELRAWSELSSAHQRAAWDHFALGVKEVVVAILLPLLTGILGYIFGTRSQDADE